MSAGPLRIAVLGMGAMGTPIANNLLKGGFELTVWNRHPSRASALVDAGARVAASPADAAEDADVVLTMVSNGPATEELMTGGGGAFETMRPGSIWIQMATVGLDWTERLAAMAAERVVEFVDAPVSGSAGPARDGELVVLASGPKDLRAMLEPIFAPIGKETLWLGEAGQGSRMKLVLNNWLATQVEATAETIALAEALGLKPELVTDTLADSPLGSPFAVAKGRAMLAGDFAPQFALRHAFKDVGLALDAAHASGLDVPMTIAIAGRWGQAMADGHGDEDVSAVFAEASPAPAPELSPAGA